MSGATALEDIGERLNHNNLKIREKALGDLKEILKNTSRFRTFEGEHIHSIFNGLFQTALKDKPSYLKASSSTTRSTAASRLSSCANLLRVSVEALAPYSLPTTAKAIVDHIVHTLPMPSGGFCEPIALDYAKSLRALLEIQAHLEHLTHEERDVLFRFCLEYIESAQSNVSDEHSEEESGMISSTRSVNYLSYRSSRSHLANSNNSQGDSIVSKQAMTEFLGCVLSLTAVSNAVFTEHAEIILEGLVQCLQSTALTETPRLIAFAAINNVLACTRIENVALTRRQILPLVDLIKRFWSLKACPQLLVTWLYILPYVSSILRGHDASSLQGEIEDVIAVMKRQYVAQLERELLQHDNLDIDFSRWGDESPHSVRTGGLQLRYDVSRPEISERNEVAWSTIFVLASLYNALSSNEANERSSQVDVEDDMSMSRKRPRLVNPLDDLIRYCTGEKLMPGDKAIPSRICATQILTFLSQQKKLTDTTLSKGLSAMSANCIEDDGDLASWAFLSLAGLVSQSDSGASHWRSIWHLATRAMTSIQTCRAACHTLLVISQMRTTSRAVVSELIQSLSASMDLNGPPVLADSSLRLITWLCKSSRKFNPTATNAFRESALRWLLRNFTPSRVGDRSYVSQESAFNSSDVINLVSACLQLPDSQVAGHPMYPTWDVVGRAWTTCTQQRELVQYLLLQPGDVTTHQPEADIAESNAEAQAPPSSTAASSVLNFFCDELSKGRKIWDQMVLEPERSISVEIFGSLCNTLCVCTGVAFELPFRDQRRHTRLQDDVRAFFESLSAYMASERCQQDKVDVALRTFSPFCGGLLDSMKLLEPSASEKLICRTISQALFLRNQAREADHDLMDIDEMFESQHSKRDDHSHGPQYLQDERSTIFSPQALRSRVVIYATIVSAACNDDASNPQNQSASSRVADYLLTLPRFSLFASGSVISSLISNLGQPITIDDSYRILDHCTAMVLDPYENERSETALGSLIDILSSLVPSWVDVQNKKLFELGSELYSYLVGTALRGGLLSPRNQRRVAKLVLQLCHIDTDYGRIDGNPSARTSLFTLVQLGRISVQHYLASRISSIFGLFVLSAHSQMFNDLLEILPHDSLWMEGMAMRLLYLSELASSWHSLLRESIYYIFETAGKVRDSTKHASQCISRVAINLGFNSPQKLFALFAPQLLHTWLESHSLTALPFAIFRYDSLEHLIRRNESEVIAQLLMRGNDDGMQLASKTLGMTVEELSRRSFAKCLAYCISWDVSKPNAGGTDNCESRLRKLVGGKEELCVLATQWLPAIIGQFYLTVQPDEDPQKWLDKHPQYSFVKKSLMEIKTPGQVEQVLPPSQQPSFKSKYLCDQIARLCRRTQHDPIKPWNASSVSLSARMVLDSIDPALGPLHTTLVIRRLRLLVCMAGDIASSGYCAEMLVLALRPFVGDARCADDAIGLIQFLLRRGQADLQKNPSFIYGSIMLEILQMQTYASKKQDSTTQETQHVALIQRMQAAQTWLVRYAEQCLPSNDSIASEKYKRLSNALSKIQLPGNAQKRSPQSELLLLLLEQLEDDSLECFSVPDCNEALQLLANGFVVPDLREDDCLGSGDDSAKFANSVWLSLRTDSLDTSYIGWAARVLGRAYATSGTLPHKERIGRLVPKPPTNFEGVAQSQQGIADLLCSSLLSRDRSESSLADHTLRKVATSFKTEAEATTFDEMLPDNLVAAIAEGTFHYQPAFLDHANTPIAMTTKVDTALFATVGDDLEQLTRSLSAALSDEASDMAILPALKPMLWTFDPFAKAALPYVVHILLDRDMQSKWTLRARLSEAVNTCFASEAQSTIAMQQFWLDIIMFLRHQPVPGENTVADRLYWLNIDLVHAAKAAVRCKMFTTGLLLLESASQPSQSGSRRGSSRLATSQVALDQVPRELLLSIFRNVEEQDSFYGVDQPASLQSVLNRLDYEEDGFKSLMFRSSQTDAQIRRSHKALGEDATGMIRSLSTLNMNSLAYLLLSNGVGDISDTSGELLSAARELQQWDIVVPDDSMTGSVTTFAILQELSRAKEKSQVRSKLQSVLGEKMQHRPDSNYSYKQRHDWYGTLASLVGIQEIVDSVTDDALIATWHNMAQRQSWMQTAPFEQSKRILSTQHPTFSIIVDNPSLQQGMRVSTRQSRELEIRSLVLLSSLARDHGHLQEALAAVTHLDELAAVAQDQIYNVESTAKFETASVLWELGELTGSVQMLQQALVIHDADRKDLSVGRPGMLAQLAHQLAEARLEKPDDILEKYLKPAINELGDRVDGKEAGKVFFEFASFCDKQLLNPENIADFNRIAKLRQNKYDEVQQLEQMSKKSKKSSDAATEYKHLLKKAKQWFEIDDADYQRLKSSRDIFTQQSLLNYLLALQASDQHDISVLRFFALWLENGTDKSANAVVLEHLPNVPSWKLVRLLNQLMSRLENEQSDFQKALQELLFRMCKDHPYHSLHHLYASTRKPAHKDQTATMSRVIRAGEIRTKLMTTLSSVSEKAQLLRNWFIADNLYNALAWENADSYKGTNVAVKDFQTAYQVASKIPQLHVPPATISLSVRPDCNYENIPVVVKFEPVMRLMSGLSKPKKMTAIGSNGEHFAALFKSGNDDMRQDAIMEQVFEEVSKMLQDHKTTRQRKLHVRTYKVIPLANKSGIIEFVPNSISLSDYLTPAHSRYYPNDYKASGAREKINAVKDHSTEVRLKEYKKICDHMHPVLRHFFFEHFTDPDQWFERRTAYTRTTASVSILGYVLGLGDRHCQNIMLDEKTGEVVHIDLGVAFEAGRVLPIPELVPFRLTRDVIDGMGITKTEGIFRRCCEFTLDALRRDKDSIMTLLNVLRYDPLYQWTISPVRAKRMQDAETAQQDIAGAGGGSSKGAEAGEADRALSIVEKKLSKTLSTSAAVNELIQQAVDERNLATLFSGWAAYF